MVCSRAHSSTSVPTCPCTESKSMSMGPRTMTRRTIPVTSRRRTKTRMRNKTWKSCETQFLLWLWRADMIHRCVCVCVCLCRDFRDFLRESGFSIFAYLDLSIHSLCSHYLSCKAKIKALSLDLENSTIPATYIFGCILLSAARKPNKIVY